MKIISTSLILVSLLFVGCSESKNDTTPPGKPPLQKPDLSSCSPEIGVQFVWESEYRNNRGYRIAFGSTENLSQMVDILDDTNSYDFSDHYPQQRGRKLYAAIGSISSNGVVNFGATYEFVFPSCAELDEILDKDPSYPYEKNYVLNLSEYYYDDHYDDGRTIIEVNPVKDYLGEVAKKPVAEYSNLNAINSELTAKERSLKDYLSAPYDDSDRVISAEPGVLLKQKYDTAERANLTDVAFPEEVPDQLCVEFLDKQPTKPQYTTLYKYQHIIPEIPGEFPGQVMTKVLAGPEVSLSDFNKYTNDLTEDSLYVGESSDLEYRGEVVSYFLRKSDGFILYKKVKEYKDKNYSRSTEESDEEEEEEEEPYEILNSTYYGYCYDKNTPVNEELVLKLNSQNKSGDKKEVKEPTDTDEPSEPELPKFEGDMQAYETELVVKLQNLIVESGEDTIFNALAQGFISSNEKAELTDFRPSRMQNYDCHEVQNYGRNSSAARGDVSLYYKKVENGYGPLMPNVSFNKVVTAEENMIREYDRYRMYNTQKSLVSFYVTEIKRESPKVSFIRRSQAVAGKWYYLRYEQRNFFIPGDRRAQKEVFFVGVCQVKS